MGPHGLPRPRTRPIRKLERSLPSTVQIRGTNYRLSIITPGADAACCWVHNLSVLAVQVHTLCGVSFCVGNYLNLMTGQGIRASIPGGLLLTTASRLILHGGTKQRSLSTVMA